MKTKVFEIIKVVGFGAHDCPLVRHATGLLFWDEEVANTEADKLWKKNTESDERNSSWCGLHYEVKEREVK